MATRFGTSHFVSRAAADRYYRDYGYSPEQVGRMLAEGEIHVGPPELRPGDVLSIIPGERRYQIERKD